MSRKSKSQNTGVRYLVLKNISLMEGKDIPAGSTVTDADVFGKADMLLAMGLVSIETGNDEPTKNTEEME